jgi:hypothetical protein
MAGAGRGAPGTAATMVLRSLPLGVAGHVQRLDQLVAAGGVQAGQGGMVESRTVRVVGVLTLVIRGVGVSTGAAGCRVSFQSPCQS